MNLVILFVAFVIGTAIGSFLNLVIFRLKSGETMWFSRSHCPKCRHDLGAIDLFPVISFFVQNGKCRYCHRSISWQYPIIELACGLLYVVFTIKALSGIYPIMDREIVFNLAFQLIMVSVLTVVFVYDLKHYLILNVVTYPFILVALVFDIFIFHIEIKEIVYALLAGAGFFFVLVVVSKQKWMGWGDVKLGALIALVVSWPNILAVMFVSFILGSFVSMILLVTKKKTMKDVVPFGTFLSASTIIFMICDSSYVAHYIKLFLL